MLNTDLIYIFHVVFTIHLPLRSDEFKSTELLSVSCKDICIVIYVVMCHNLFLYVGKGTDTNYGCF